jgi:hypothetical protein
MFVSWRKPTKEFWRKLEEFFKTFPHLSGVELLRLFWLMPEEFLNLRRLSGVGEFYEFG